MLAEVRTGPIVASDGVVSPARADKAGNLTNSPAHTGLHECTYRGTMFSFGATSTTLAAANAVATGVTSSAQPIIGVWNPATSTVNLAIQKVLAVCTVVAASAVAPGGFVYLVSTNQSAISTGSNPFNNKTLAQTGSAAKAFAFATALTGLSGSLVTMRASTIGCINQASTGPATAISQPTGPTEELIDGSIIVPPGGVFVMMNQLSTTTVSYNAGIVWEEVPV